MSTLAVDTITPNSASAVLMPNKPAFRAYQSGSAGYQEITHSVWTKMPLNFTEFNVGNHYSTSTYDFTVPISGIYYFYVQAYMPKAGNNRYVAIYKNGSRISSFQMQGHTDDDSSGGTAIMLNLNSGDTVSPYFLHSADHSQSYYIDSIGSYTYFMGYLIG